MATSASTRRSRRDDLVEWLPIALAGAFVLVLAVLLGDVVSTIYRDSDAASGPVIADLLSGAPSDRVAYLGYYPWYEWLWFLRLTHGAPHERLLWEGAPVVLYAITVAMVARGTWSALGRRAGLLAIAVLVCIGAPARQIFLTGNFHMPTVAHAALLALACVALARRADRARRWQLAVAAIVLGLITSAATASDSLSTAAVIAPAAGTALALWFRDRRQRDTALCLLAACVIAVVAGAQWHQAMLDRGILPQPFPLGFIAGDKIAEHLQGFVQAFAALVGGDVFGRPVEFASIVRLGMLALATAAVVLIARDVRDRLRAPGALARSGLASEQDAARFAHVAFWSLCAAGTLAAYLLASTPSDAGTGRYLAPLWPAIAALVGLLANGSHVRRAAVGFAVALFAAGATVTLVLEGGDEHPGLITNAEIDQLARYAARMHVRSGLGGYEDAANITWATHDRLRVLAVTECNQAYRFCPFPVHRVTSSYAPATGERSLLIVDPRQPVVTGPDPRHGPAIATTKIGAMTVYVYGYDIRSRLTGT